VQIADAMVLARPGPYFLLVPIGTYRIAAFEDRSGDRIPDPGDPTTVLFDGRPVEARPREQTSGLDLTLRRGTATPVEFPNIAVDVRVGLEEVPQAVVGEVTDLDDPRFSATAATTGLWRPVDFLFDIGAGIYFLEPYDPDRVPVLFVHGALGHPGDWRFLVEHLDRSRYQAWFAYYPTAVRIELIAASLGRVQELNLTYDFDPPVLVAHSMGGLVTRALINQNLGGPDEAPDPSIFVTISTPWLGQSAAAIGLRQAPVAAPSWYDMAPGSPLLEALLQPPLPPQVAHHLLFTYGGGAAWLGEPNDGAVTLASQLAPRAQQQAVKVLGFNASHSGVLTDPAVSDEINRILVTP
jgi:pimeloyl-ACP methyl ester carboxylesterase